MPARENPREGVNDCFGIDPVFRKNVLDITRLTESVDAKRKYAVASHASEPGQAQGWPSQTDTRVASGERRASRVSTCASARLAIALSSLGVQPSCVEPIGRGDHQNADSIEVFAHLLARSGYLGSNDARTDERELVPGPGSISQ